jgi:hypothetical protein
MSMNLPDIKAFGTAPFEAFTAATASSTKGLQTIAAETTDYSKKSFEKSRVLFEKLTGVKKIDEAIQLQSDFAKSAYEDFVAHATKIGELYSSLAKEAFKPITVTSPAKPSVVAEPPKAAVVTKSLVATSPTKVASPAQPSAVDESWQTPVAAKPD